MARQFLDSIGLARFKEKLVGLLNTELANKQDKGDYVTKKDLEGLGIGIEFSNYGNPRNRDSSDPTYGLESILIAGVIDTVDTGERRTRDPNKPSFGL